MAKLEPDLTKLTPEQRDKLDNYNSTQTQLRHLSDIADMTQEVINLLAENDDKKEIGAVLLDIRESLVALKDKEAPETPDYSKPVIDAISKLEKALTASVKSIDVKPNIKVDAPAVNVSPPSVDLKGVEKAVKEIPKAFEQAVKLIPIPEKPDNSELLSAWEGISEQLESIDTATRMKPLPGSMSIKGVTLVNGKIPVDVDMATEGIATEASLLKLIKVQFTDDVSIATTVLGNVTTYVKSGTTNNALYNTQTIVIDNDNNTITKTWSLV